MAAQTTVYILSGEHISTETDPSIPLYHLSKSVDSLTHRVSSMQFSRVIIDNGDETKDNMQLQDSSFSSPSSSSSSPIRLSNDKHQHQEHHQKLKLYNLVHPSNAQYRTDIPAAYYMTSSSNSPSSSALGLGNIKLVSSSSPSSSSSINLRKKLIPFRKPTFTALLHPEASSKSSPLFPPLTSQSQTDGRVETATGFETLFMVRQTLGRGGRVWEWSMGVGDGGGSGSSGKQTGAAVVVVAREEGDGSGNGDRKLVVTMPPPPPPPTTTTLEQGEGKGMAQKLVDALVALWVLRLWWGVAEEKEFQKEALMAMTPPESAYGYGGMSKMNKRAGALGAFAAAGGAC